MPAIVEFPTVVKTALVEFGPLFANKPERVHFAEYLTSLLVANRKNVSAINRRFAETTVPSCLNRWLTEVEWDVEKLNQQRLRWLQECFHWDGKQHLGMGNCQLRNGQGQPRHLYMVFLAHSVLMRQLRQGRAREWALERRTTSGQTCGAVLRRTLSQTIAWLVDHLENGWN